MRVFVLGFRASHKWISRNLKSASVGLSETSLKNITWSPCAEEGAVEAFGFIRMADETADFPLGFITMAEDAVDFRFGLACAEEARVILLVLRSLEIEELPLGSIVLLVWEKLFNFDRHKSKEKRFILRKMVRKLKRIHWMRWIKVWLGELVVKSWVKTESERRVGEDLEVKRGDRRVHRNRRENDWESFRRSSNKKKKEAQNQFRREEARES